LFCEKII